MTFESAVLKKGRSTCRYRKDGSGSDPATLQPLQESIQHVGLYASVLDGLDLFLGLIQCVQRRQLELPVVAPVRDSDIRSSDASGQAHFPDPQAGARSSAASG